MLIDPKEFLTITLLIFVTVLVPIILVQIILLLKRADKVVRNAEQISESIAEITDDEGKMQEFVQEIVSYTANDVIQTQSNNIMQSASKAIASFLVKRLPV